MRIRQEPWHTTVGPPRHAVTPAVAILSESWKHWICVVGCRSQRAWAWLLGLQTFLHRGTLRREVIGHSHLCCQEYRHLKLGVGGQGQVCSHVHSPPREIKQDPWLGPGGAGAVSLENVGSGPNDRSSPSHWAQLPPCHWDSSLLQQKWEPGGPLLGGV